MPIPKSHAGESEKDFVSRCMGDSVMVADYPETDQRAAVCYKAFTNEDPKGNLIVDGIAAVWRAIDFVVNQKDGEETWVQLSPYGDFPNTQGMQRLERADAENIVNDFKGSTDVGVRALGLPWYVGHPDHDRFKTTYTDKRAYGRIKDLRAGEHGLEARVRFNEDGQRMIQNENFHGHSVHWGMIKDGTVFRPVTLKSVGFTNEPNIPVQPVTAANEQDPNMLKALLQLLGLPDETTEADCMSNIGSSIAQWKTNQAALDNMTAQYNETKGKLDTIMDAHRKVAEDAQKATNERDAIQTTVDNLKTELTAANEKATKAEEQFANERKARATELAKGLVETGKILKAECEQYEAMFVNEFEATVKKVEGMKPKMNRISVVDPARRRQLDAEQLTRTEQVHKFVNEKMETPEFQKMDGNVRYDAAFAAVRKENPALFEQMVQPKAA